MIRSLIGYLRYIIVDYERSKFSVSQCRFEDGVSTDLVAISSATEISNHSRRNVAIGTSIGVTSLLLLAAFSAIFVVGRWRQKKSSQLSSEATEPHTPFQEPRAPVVSLARQIGHNSMFSPFRELSDSAKAEVELLNEQAPSGSGKEIFEMTEDLLPVSHELRTNRGPHVMVQTRNPNSNKIFKSTKIRGESWPSFASSGGACVETVISASNKRKESNMDRASIITSVVEAEIYALYIRESLDLDRSLPPTPIPESPQLSPKFNERSPFRQAPQMVNTSARGSMSAFISPEMPVLSYAATFSKHQHLPLCDVDRSGDHT